MMDPLQIFDKFQLNTIDEEWYVDIWDKEFIIFSDPPRDYAIFLGSEDINQILRDTIITLKRWVEENKDAVKTNETQRSEVSCQTFQALDINMKALVAVLGYLIKMGQLVGADEDARQNCLASTSLYFLLLSIPGSTTFHIFHENLYQRAIETLKLCEHLIEIKKPRRTNNLESLYYSKPEDMLKSEKNTLIKSLNSVLFDFIIMLKTFYMKYQSRLLEFTISSLIEVTKLEVDHNPFSSNNQPSDASRTTLSYNAFVALQDLCTPDHGEVEDTIRMLMKYLKSSLSPHQLDLPSKAVSLISDAVIHFIKNLLSTKKGLADLGVEILVQHLLVKGPERSEARQKSAQIISKLINVCEGDLFFRCITHLVKFSHHSKYSFRIFSQEICSDLIMLIIRNQDSQSSYKTNIVHVLISLLWCRCIDSSNMVRGKALAMIEVLQKGNIQINNFVDTSDESKSLATLEILLSSINSETNPLPGSKAIIDMLMDRIEDERALVRKSAMNILEKLAVHFPFIIDSISPSIGKHCRDPALIVRQSAIQVLWNLLETYPQNQIVLKVFIKNVLPRIFDVENKVQEKVLQSLQNLILEKIRKFGNSFDEMSILPWNIINMIMEEKMKINLSKACDIWINKKPISPTKDVLSDTIVENILSHIGTHRNNEAWLLLSCITEYRCIKSLDTYFQNYELILKSKDFGSYLILQVLRDVWPELNRDFLEKLCNGIYEHLSQYHVSLESIGTCIDILNGIGKKLENSSELNQNFIENLIELSEIQIEDLVEEIEEITDEMVYLHLKAMCTLGHASLYHSKKVSENTISILQSLLLECDEIPNAYAYKNELKAGAIVALGQQALRDRDLAEQVMPIFGRLMCRNKNIESSSIAAVRINSVKALADLCIRFTALVEPYLPNMYICMKDSDAAVREITVVIFVQLLLEDYIKVKGVVFFHILTMLSDPNETVKELTMFLIKERILTKDKNLIAHSFLKSIFHYNNCPIKMQTETKTKERKYLTLPGSNNESKRRLIYDFMLEHLDAQKKQKILETLTLQVIDGVSEGLINIRRNETVCVLRDAFYIIQSDPMQPSNMLKINEEDLDDSTITQDVANNSSNAIAENIKIFKSKVLIPQMFKLLIYLKKERSELEKEVVTFLTNTIVELSKDQITEIIQEYPSFKEEIENERRKSSKRRETSTSGNETSHLETEFTNLSVDDIENSTAVSDYHSKNRKKKVEQKNDLVDEEIDKLLQLSNDNFERTSKDKKDAEPQNLEDNGPITLSRNSDLVKKSHEMILKSNPRIVIHRLPDINFSIEKNTENSLLKNDSKSSSRKNFGKIKSKPKKNK